MPIEIRELSISTRIAAAPAPQPAPTASDLHQLKQELMQECMKILKAQRGKSDFDR